MSFEKKNCHSTKIESDKNVVVKCSDTDIVVIMLGNLQEIEAKIYIDCEVISRINRM